MPEADTTDAPPEGTDANKTDPPNPNGNGSQEPPKGGDDKPPKSEVDEATEKHLGDLRKENASWRRKLRDAEKQIETLTATSATEVEKATAAARQEAIGEAMGEANKRLLRAEVLAAAAGKIATPSHAFAILKENGQLEGLEPNDQGEFDNTKIASAVEELVKTHPYLAATRDPEFGARPPANSGQTPDQAFDNFIRQHRR